MGFLGIYLNLQVRTEGFIPSASSVTVPESTRLVGESLKQPFGMKSPVGIGTRGSTAIGINVSLGPTGAGVPSGATGAGVSSGATGARVFTVVEEVRVSPKV